MRLSLIITLFLIFILLYSISEMKLNIKRRNIYTLVFVGIIIANSFLLFDYSKVKSNHNFSTITTYDGITDIFTSLNSYEIKDVSDVKEFRSILEILSHQSALLAYQLKDSILVEGENDSLILSFLSLNAQLSKFETHHNNLAAKGIDISKDKIPLYNDFKLSIIEFGDEIRSENRTIGGNLIGITEYKIKLKRNNIKEYNSIINLMSKINSNIIED